MQRTVRYIVVAVIAAFLLEGCNNGLTLQRYFVDHQETKNFITQDLPTSMLKLSEANLTAAQKEALQSVKRLNFLGFKADSSNTAVYNSELSKVKAILNQKKYNDLIDFSYQGAKVTMKYIGNDDEADEVVIFGSSKNLGFGIVRILGDDMTPDKMMSLRGLIQNNDFDSSQVDTIVDFFK